MQAIFRSIALAPNQTIQDTLRYLKDLLKFYVSRILTLLFAHGQHKEVEAALIEGFSIVSIDTWLQVIPQVRDRMLSFVHNQDYCSNSVSSSSNSQADA